MLIGVEACHLLKTKTTHGSSLHHCVLPDRPDFITVSVFSRIAYGLDECLTPNSFYPLPVHILRDRNMSTCHTVESTVGQVLLTVCINVQFQGVYDIIISGQGFTCSPITGLALITRYCSPGNTTTCDITSACMSYKALGLGDMAQCHYQCDVDAKSNQLGLLWNTDYLPNVSICEMHF